MFFWIMVSFPNHPMGEEMCSQGYCVLMLKHKAGYHGICLLPWKCPHTVQHFDTDCFFTSSINTAHIKLPLEFATMTSAAGWHQPVQTVWLLNPDQPGYSWGGFIRNNLIYQCRTLHLLSARMNRGLYTCYQCNLHPCFPPFKDALKMCPTTTTKDASYYLKRDPAATKSGVQPLQIVHRCATGEWERSIGGIEAPTGSTVCL